MGDIDQWKKRVYADFDECWQDLISEENLKDIFPAPLCPRETLIFMLGLIAAQRGPRRAFTVLENFTFNDRR